MDSPIGTFPAAVKNDIAVSGLALKRGGKRLFCDMTWKMPRGSFLAVTGPSGAGKTSLLACLRGTLPPAEGSCDLGGDTSIAIGTVFQHLRLTAESSVLTNVLCGRLGHYPWWRTLFGFSSADQNDAYRFLNELGLGPLAYKPVKNISGGEQQRTAIARVLFQTPRMILADEPTSNLDHVLAQQVLERFRGLCTERSCTVISVLHDRDLVERFADLELQIGVQDEKQWRLRRIERQKHFE